MSNYIGLKDGFRMFIQPQDVKKYYDEGYTITDETGKKVPKSKINKIKPDAITIDLSDLLKEVNNG